MLAMPKNIANPKTSLILLIIGPELIVSSKPILDIIIGIVAPIKELQIILKNIAEATTILSKKE